MYEVRFYHIKRNTLESVSWWKFDNRDKAVEFGEKYVGRYERYQVVQIKGGK